jgi:hypothetical protein
MFGGMESAPVILYEIPCSYYSLLNSLIAGNSLPLKYRWKFTLLQRRNSTLFECEKAGPSKPGFSLRSYGKRTC